MNLTMKSMRGMKREGWAPELRAPGPAFFFKSFTSFMVDLYIQIAVKSRERDIGKSCGSSRLRVIS